ncbi:chromosome partitioning protein, ParB family [Ekhidna lutea]|uniref:Chromosome partitioning protein, ParB family n=1 Tax=Ekhidna lutea TaxID=447679 RepID=A0A239HEL8_EKHLU|nr:ParB/RepB/Spo0J family partition protein [Ekhidna lutea]SNS79478.1 chromosome partitioning protein, ParB family [Ekhidna lutea]
MAESKFKKRSGLGRGLGALLEDSGEKEKISGSGATPKGAINEIEISQIETNPWQPRSDFDEDALNDLAESIKVQGIIQPITVRALSEKEFQLISGERRLQACKKAGLKTIPAYIRIADDQQMLEMALIENIQRENLNAIEIALSYQRLLAECDLKQEELGDRVGKNRSTVTNYLRLLKLPPDIQIALRDGRLSMGHARALISIEDVSFQLDIFNQIIKNDLSVRKVEELVRSKGKKEEKESKPSEIDPEIRKLQGKLSTHFGSKIAIKSNEKNKGEIKIPFASTEDLNRILEILDI